MTERLDLKKIPIQERPREKMKKLGPGALKNHELMAVILGRGSRKEGVIERAQRIVDQYKNWDVLREQSVDELQSSLDLPFTQACQVAAVFELGRRLFKEADEVFLSSPQSVFNYVRNMAHLKKEHLKGLYLDTRNRLVREETISIGTLNSSPAHPREVFQPAIESSCAAVILVHNHPSGDPTPSELDIALTKKLVDAGKLLEIPLLDHLIVAQKGFISLKERGVIK
jgi:DNA repair protein RadC